MPAKKSTSAAEKITQRKARPATTPESREKQLVNLAVDLAEKQLRDGSASPSVINHFLKIASSRDVLEREILEKQSKLIEAKASSISKDREAEELAKAAINAMKNYQSSTDA